ILAGVQPAAEGRPAALGVNDEKLIESVPAWDPLSRMLLPAIGRSFELHQRMMSNMTRAQLSAAVAAYQRKTGRPPRNLQDLVPASLPSIPIDPTTGRAFAYSTAGGPTGLELISRQPVRPTTPLSEDADVLSTARTAAAPPPSEWRRYVDMFVEEHRLDAA